MTDLEIGPKNKKTKKRFIRRCLVWTMVVLVGFLAIRFYWTERNMLVLSHSLDEQHTVKIINRGTEGFFGRSHVRIRYKNQYIDRDISNDGKNLSDFNVSVEWTSEDVALITLTGEEQYPEIIEFNSKRSDVFQTIQVVIGSKVVTTSVSPNRTKMIKIRAMIRSEGEKSEEFLRYYYGGNGSRLEEYEEVDFFYSTDQYEINWVDDNHVAIDRISKEKKLKETVEIDFN